MMKELTITFREKSQDQLRVFCEDAQVIMKRGRLVDIRLTKPVGRIPFYVNSDEVLYVVLEEA